MKNSSETNCKQCGAVAKPKHKVNPYLLWIPIVFLAITAKAIDDDLTLKLTIGIPALIGVTIWIWYYFTGRRFSDCKTKEYK